MQNQSLKSYINDVVDGYIQCALWSSNDEGDERGGNPLDQNYTTKDIHPDSLAKMRQDCINFVGAAYQYLLLANDDDPGYVGHNFWLTRNGHGAGFWDSPERYGGQGNADMISEIARSYSDVNLYVGDDGSVYEEWA